MKFKWLALLICIVVISNISAFAKLAWDDNEFISADQLHAGLQGYGKTVYEGTKIEKFDIEVIGVLHNVDINFDMILIKVLNGPVPDKKMQSVAGMSGSPIYINDKLIGAYAYGWNFQNEAIAGVTPIAAMLDSTEPGSSQLVAGTYKPEKGILKIGDKLITRVKIADNMLEATKLNAQSDPTTMILSPVSTPLFVTGLPDSAMKPLQAVFEKYNVRVMQGATMDGVGAGTTTLDPKAKLEAGSAVAVSLIEGDANLSAVGTVTYVKDNTVLCFGHPFMGLGKINFPMSAAYVHGIISSMQGSFKLASPAGRVGTAVSDRNFALAGTIGLEPDTIRAIMTLTDDSRKLKSSVVVDVCNSQQFTPFILYSWMMLGGAAQLGNLQTDEGTYTADTVFMTDKLGNLRQHMVASPAAGGGMPMGDFMRLSDALINNPYEPVKINRLYLNLSYNPERNIAIIESVIPDRLVVKPGDTVNFDVKIRPYGKPTENTTISVKIPNNTIDNEMLVAIAGGSHGSMFKPLTVAPAVPDEGISGIVRWIQSGSIAPNSLVAAALYPTLSYPHAGEYIRDLPIPLLETLMITDNGTGMIPQQNKKSGNRNQNQPNESSKGDDGVAMMMGDAVPTLYVKTEESKYILAGGSIIPLTIIQKSIVNNGRNRGDISVMSPLLSSSIAAPENNEGRRTPPNADNEEDYYSTQVWMTAQHKDAYKRFVNALSTSLPSVRSPFNMPRYRKGAFVPARPLSASAMDDNAIEIDATPDKPSADNSPSTSKKTGKPTPGMIDDDIPGGNTENVKDGVLLTHKRPSWGLTSAADFLRGDHFGTSVTSKGALMLSPGMRQLFNTGEMMPWRMAATADGIFVGGWRNNNLVKVNKEGAGETIFPKEDMPQVKAITAITNDAAGNIIFSTWPDNIVRQISANGTVKSKWELPSPVWDIAITVKNKIYAASNNGSIYLLENDGDIVLICQLPDSHIYALATGSDGNLYMATAPQGKIYKLDTNDAVTAIANCKGTISSLAVDARGNVYAGMAGSCRVNKITPDGAQTIIMRGMSGINRHVLALKMLDGDLYAATGPAGGIYKIANPASSEPEVSVIYARSDERTGINENEVLGSESVMVNALAIGTDGKLLAAAAMPGQILQIQPRATGSFNSAVLTSPSVATWGQFDAHIRSADGQSVKIESRTGRTATPDLTWSTWSNIDLKSMVVDSNPSLYAQFRITLNSADKTSPVLDFLKLYYTPTNSAPAVKLATPRTGEYLNGEIKLKWMGIDTDGDELIYCLYISKDDGKTWKQLTEGLTADTSDKGMPMADEEMPKKKTSKKDKPIIDEKVEELKATELTVTEATWNSKSVGDGKYRLKVVATDKYARPTDPKNGEYITGEFIIDNTAPEIVAIPDQIIGWKMIERMIVEDKTSPIIGGRFRIDNLPWVAITPDFSSFGSKRVNILLTTPNGPVEKLPKGNHTVQVQAEDAAGNKLDRTFRIEPKTKATVFTNATGTKTSKDPDSKELIELMMYPIDGKK